MRSGWQQVARNCARIALDAPNMVPTSQHYPTRAHFPPPTHFSILSHPLPTHPACSPQPIHFPATAPPDLDGCDATTHHPSISTPVPIPHPLPASHALPIHFSATHQPAAAYFPATSLLLLINYPFTSHPLTINFQPIPNQSPCASKLLTSISHLLPIHFPAVTHPFSNCLPIHSSIQFPTITFQLRNRFPSISNELPILFPRVSSVG